MEYWLPVIYMAAMGLALFVYVILDGYDLGVGMLLPLASETEKDVMVASIGPFWDANETWIVLGVGILLIAFPSAHGIVLTKLYLPVTLMLIGLTLRGVAFDLRIKAGDQHKELWNNAFFLGSLIAAVAQGWMVGSYVTGLDYSVLNILFSLLIAVTLPTLYILLGAGWLLMKTRGELLVKAHRWGRNAILPMGFGLLLVSIATPVVSERIAERWFEGSNFARLWPVPVATLIAYLAILNLARADSWVHSGKSWYLYALTVFICVMASLGLGYSLFPYIIVDQLNIWQAAAATESLLFTFFGVVLAVPAIIAYTIYVYRVFHGRNVSLSYE